MGERYGSGYARTDMWGVLKNGSTVTDNPINGFTNQGLTDSFVGFHICNNQVGLWVELSATVDYNV